MNYRVEVTRRAWTDALDARDWIARDAPARARRWYERLLDTIDTLAERPQRCPLARENDDFPFELRHLLYGRRGGVYRILFTIREDRVVVLAIRHGARQPVTPAMLEHADDRP